MSPADLSQLMAKAKEVQSRLAEVQRFPHLVYLRLHGPDDALGLLLLLLFDELLLLLLEFLGYFLDVRFNELMEVRGLLQFGGLDGPQFLGEIVHVDGIPVDVHPYLHRLLDSG